MWKWFEHPISPNGERDKTKIKCNQCGVIKSYKSNTTNMWSHLTHMHYHCISNELPGASGSSHSSENSVVKCDIDIII